MHTTGKKTINEQLLEVVRAAVFLGDAEANLVVVFLAVDDVVRYEQDNEEKQPTCRFHGSIIQRARGKKATRKKRSILRDASVDRSASSERSNNES
jgi:hypothetical protein